LDTFTTYLNWTYQNLKTHNHLKGFMRTAALSIWRSIYLSFNIKFVCYSGMNI